RPMISRSASGEGEILKAAMIHRSFGMTTSRARIAAPISQFTTIRIRNTTYAIGSAADEASCVDMIQNLSISNINNTFIDCRQVGYRKTIRNQMFRREFECPNAELSCKARGLLGVGARSLFSL